MKTSAIYPGSFDPVHNGHLDIIQRAALLFDEVIVLVSDNSEKKHLFTVSERISLVQKSFYPGQKVVSVIGSDSLVTDVMKAHDIKYMIRGMRNTLDAAEELKLFEIYRTQYNNMETFLIMPKIGNDTSYLSSSLIKEIAKRDGVWEQWVPKHVAQAIKEKLK